MKQRPQSANRPGDSSDGRPGRQPSPTPARVRHPVWRVLIAFLVVMLLLGIAARLMLPAWARGYVNRTLDQSPLYSGSVGKVSVHLWRGAYAIHDVHINKVTASVPVPLFAAPRVDFAIRWGALLEGSIVGRVLIIRPQLNFVDAPDESGDQTGAGAPWLQMIQDLFPFRIDAAVIRQGAVHFRAFQFDPPVDVYMSGVEAAIENLTNIRDEARTLISTVEVTGQVMDDADFELNMTLDPFSYRPTFNMAARLLGLDVTRLNELARAYGNFDFEDGRLDLVVEANATEGRLTGYVKPLFRGLEVFSLSKDFGEENVLLAFWQALVGVVTDLFKNQPRDQFGTLIPFSADLSGATNADILATIGNVLRNAFIRAYLPRLEGSQTIDGLEFQPADLTDPLSVGDPP